MSSIIKKYFPEITAHQMEQFDALGALYAEWNEKINVISRKDIGNLYERHILHSLGIAAFLHFPEGAAILDVGTGGGFPGIPLAILFPGVRFHLIDGTGKKIKVARSVAEAAGLGNVTTGHCRIEEEKSTFDFVVSRAVMTLPELVKCVKKNIDRRQRSALPNGVICLKGGDLQKETAPFGKNIIIAALSDYFHETYFETKKVIYIPL
jgi:16S rRNA (guanine527-N7)-methyltransferase